MLLRHAATILVLATTTLISLPETARADGTAETKPKATKASVTAAKLKLETARVDIQALAKLSPPAGLSAAERKTFDLEIAKLDPIAAKTQTVVKAMDTALKDPKANLDSLSEMGEMESLRLQQEMDRVAKVLAALSNLLKKHADTASGIVQNMK